MPGRYFSGRAQARSSQAMAGPTFFAGQIRDNGNNPLEYGIEHQDFFL